MSSHGALTPQGEATLEHPNLHLQRDAGQSPGNGPTWLVPAGEGTDSWTRVAAGLWAPSPFCLSGELANTFPLL